MATCNPGGWDFPAKKLVLNGPPIKGLFLDHFASELSGHTRYTNKTGTDERGAFTFCSTWTEVVTYIAKRREISAL